MTNSNSNDQTHSYTQIAPLSTADMAGKPFCVHYGECGGCNTQHLEEKEYIATKTASLYAALENQEKAWAGAIKPLIRINASRRRTAPALYRDGARVIVGFKQARSLRIVPVNLCPVLMPELNQVLAATSDWLGPLIPTGVRLALHLTAAANGIDARLVGCRPPKGAEMNALMRRSSSVPHLLRLAINDEVLYQAGEPYVSCAGVDIKLPVGSFLQPSQAGQELLTAQVLRAVADYAPPGEMLDLFSGIGVYAAALSNTGRKVTTYESHAESVACSAAALPSVSCNVRDLYRHPVTPNKGTAAVIINPPRQGAQAQSVTLAAGNVPCIIYISCNPVTLVRDGELLINSGYTCRSLQPIDQFAYTSHLECIAIFTR